VSWPAPVIEEHAGLRGRLLVVRDDVIPGGTKSRAILPLLSRSDAAEFVYASPAQGYAQVALGHCARRLGRRATVFTAARASPHPLTRAARAAGARIESVRPGYLAVVQARAREYCARTGAELLPFGVDSPVAIEGIAAAARLIAPPREVWTVAGSGVLTRALQRAWPSARFFAIVVGKKNPDIGRATPIIYPAPFERAAKTRPPFPSALNYDAKGWEIAHERAIPGALFWNVGA
jgi:hypothetical protein